MLGMQIVQDGKITDFEAANDFFREVMAIDYSLGGCLPPLFVSFLPLFLFSASLHSKHTTNCLSSSMHHRGRETRLEATRGEVQRNLRETRENAAQRGEEDT